jgi:hypothetical protein
MNAETAARPFAIHCSTVPSGSGATEREPRIAVTAHRTQRHPGGYVDPPTVPIAVAPPVPVGHHGRPWLSALAIAVVVGLALGGGAFAAMAALGDARVDPAASAPVAAPQAAPAAGVPAGPVPAAPSAAPQQTAGPEPTLGAVWGPGGQKGFGEVRPTETFAGGDPTSILEDLRWSGWGEPTATATGTGDWTPPDGIVADSVPRPARVTASNLGTCHGKPAYRTIKWYFPTEGETAADSGGFDDICDGP